MANSEYLRKKLSITVTQRKAGIYPQGSYSGKGKKQLPVQIARPSPLKGMDRYGSGVPPQSRLEILQ